MELRVLRYFLAVAHEGNVTRAAAMLHITQPTLSRQLAELERELGCELFLRTSHGIELTREGRQLRQRAEEMIMLEERTVREIGGPMPELVEEVYLGLAETRAVAVVGDAIRALRETNPNIVWCLHSGNALDLVERIEGGLLDFGLLVGRGCPDTCNMVILPHEDRWGLVVPKDDPLALLPSIASSELADLPVLLSEQPGHGDRTGVTGCLPGSRGMNVVGSYNLAYNAVVMVERGCGYAVTLEGLYGADGPRTVFVPISDAIPLRSILIWKKGRTLSRAASLFLDEIRQRCGRG